MPSLFPKLQTIDYLWAALALALLLISVMLPAEHMSQWLLGAEPAPQAAVVTQGAAILKLLLAIDALLLMLFVVSRRSLTQTTSSAFVPIWQPAQRSESIADKSAFVWLTVAVLCLSIVLRLYQLNSDLWIDEVLTLVNYVRLPFGSVLTNFADDNQHLLFSLLARICVVIFGESAWSLRIPAVAAGVLSIAMTAHLARYLFGNRVALLSALMLCVSWHHIWYSQNARGYTLLLLGTLCATYFLLRALEKGRLKYWFLYALAIALGAMSHLTAVFVAIAHAAVVFWWLIIKFRSPGDWLLPLTGFAMSAWLTLHAYALVLPQISEYFLQDDSNAVRLDNPWRNPLWLVNETLRSLGISLTLDWVHLFTGAALSLLSAWFLRRKDWLFILLAVLPGALLVIAMIILDRNLWPRLFFNLAGFVVIVMAAGCLFVGDMIARPFKNYYRSISWMPGLLVCLAFAQSLGSLYQYPKQDFTGARDFIQSQTREADTVVGIHMAGKMNRLFYEPSWTDVNSLHELQRARSSDADTWVVYTLDNYLKRSRPDLYQELMTNSELIREFPGTLGDGKLIVRRFNHGTQVRP